jgi:hypothetical protein
MKQPAAIIAPVALVLLASCTAAPPSPGGTVTGRLLLEGGASRFNGPRPISGSVQFMGPHQQLATVRVGNSGTFSVVLLAGTYHVSGRSPHVIEVSNGQVPCTQPLSVSVTPRHATKITLTCIVP